MRGLDSKGNIAACASSGCIARKDHSSGAAVACTKVLQAFAIKNGTETSAGVLVVLQADALPEVWDKLIHPNYISCHTSQSYGVGYFASCMERPKVSIFRSQKQQSQTLEYKQGLI